MPDDDEVGLRIARAARSLPRSIAIAESLTGGALSARLARLPDASEWYRGAVVTYAADVKHSVLGAPPEIVEKFEKRFGGPDTLKRTFSDFVDQLRIGSGMEDAKWAQDYLLKWSGWA